MTLNAESGSEAPANAAGTSEIIRTTGERVENSFWATLNELLLRIPCRANGIELPFPTQVNLLRPYRDEEDQPNKLDGLPETAHS